MGEKMINLTIDGVQLQVPEGTSVMSAGSRRGNRSTASVLFKRHQ